jgi:transposase
MHSAKAHVRSRGDLAIRYSTLTPLRGRVWNYHSEAWARRFFENWKQALKWQRLKPYEKFARMIDRHWDGIAAYCQPRNKVPLGFVEGLNNKIRVLQRRAYGLRDEEYLRLKILTCMLPEI